MPGTLPLCGRGLLRVSAARLYRYDLPFSEPVPSGGWTLHRREGLLLELADGTGAVGLGEASPLPGFSRESVEEAARQLRDLAAAVSGRDVTPGMPLEEAGLPLLSPSARFAFELALCGLGAASRKELLPGVVSPGSRSRVPLNGLLSGSREEVLPEAGRLREAGYRAVKLKVGRRSVEDDVGLVRELGGLLGNAVSLRLDANRAWSPGEAYEFARGVAGVELEYVEEPLADPALLPGFAKDSGLPVALDESLVGLAPERLGEHGYAAALVLKPTLLGGISRTLELADRGMELGMVPVVSSAFETGIGTLGLVALAAGIGEAPAGLDTYRWLGADVSSPPLTLGAVVDVPALLGVERELDRRYLEELPV
ncbi:MAG: o-succinylbenzoate synthase [Rubrobacter sp.]|nr:o-succinylbenzoate synthase [Rubrobacter sp.]